MCKVPGVNSSYSYGSTLMHTVCMFQVWTVRTVTGQLWSIQYACYAAGSLCTVYHARAIRSVDVCPRLYWVRPCIDTINLRPGYNQLFCWGFYPPPSLLSCFMQCVPQSFRSYNYACCRMFICEQSIDSSKGLFFAPLILVILVITHYVCHILCSTMT